MCWCTLCSSAVNLDGVNDALCLRYIDFNESSPTVRSNYSWLGRGIPILVCMFSFGCLADRLYTSLEPKALPSQPPPQGLASVSAESCSTCHEEIYREWAGSGMGQSFTDPVFQADWSHQREFYYCLSCHAPLEAQQPTVVTGLRGLNPPREVSTVNPLFDKDLQAEGVTCVVCHLEEGALVGPHSVAAPHKVAQDPNFSASDRCERCHQMVSPPFPFSKSDRPLTDTHSEWSEWKEVTGRTESCTDCHMPEVNRPSAHGAPPRQGRRHTFPGGWDNEMVRSGLIIGEPSIVDGSIKIVLTNQAGHRFPSGEPARSLVVTARLWSEDAKQVAEAVERIERRVKLPVGKELGDSTLAPAERRELTLSFGAETQGQATKASLSIVFDRLANLNIDQKIRPSNTTVELAYFELDWTIDAR